MSRLGVLSEYALDLLAGASGLSGMGLILQYVRFLRLLACVAEEGLGKGGGG